METLWQDIRQGARILVKNPGFTLTVALTLGLGLGANAAVFSIVNALLLRPLPVRDPGNLYLLTSVHEENQDPHPVSYKDYLDYRSHGDLFSDLAAYSIGFVGLSADNRADRIAVANVTGNYFPMLGITPAHGRFILPTEGEAFGADPVIVLGHSYWKKRFNGDPSVVGRTVHVNARPFTVVGVVPEAFLGTYALVEFDAYLPAAMLPTEAEYRERTERRDNHEMRVIGRLGPGVSQAQAQAGLDVVARQLEQQYPDTNRTVRMRLIPEHLARPEANAADSNPYVAGVFLLLVGLVLLVACVNVVNLLMVQAAARQREFAVRSALGAGRTRLIRQLLTESLLLSLMGALGGAAIGRWVSGMIARIPLPADIPIRFDLTFDWRVFAYIAAIALGTGLLVGLLPALRASRTNLNDVLREGGRGMAEGTTRQRLRGLLVISQVAVSLVLLVAAGLLVRSVQRAQSVDLGFDHRNVLNLSMDVSQQGLDDVRGAAFYKEVEDRVRALPGAQFVSYAYSVPFGYYSAGEYIEVDGRPVEQGQRRPAVSYNLVGAEYFDTLRIPILRGRRFSLQDDDHAPRVAIVNQLMAERMWPGEDAIGKRFRLQGPDSRWFEVVGISKEGKYNFIFQDRTMYFFVPLAQHYRAQRALHVRTGGEAEAMAPLVQKEIRALNPHLPVYDVRSMTRMMDGGNGFFLLNMGALFGGTLGLLGLVLALVGIYGVVSYAAFQRTQEIGVRMALGAQRTDILRLVVGQGLALVAIGILIGLAAAFGVSRLLGNLLFGISASDATTFVAVPIMLGCMATLASYIPAFRATRIDPIVALRME
jgi:putative ABC transport system permease protein